MYVNAKIIPVETVLGIREGDERAVEGVNSNMRCLIHCKNLCKCHNVLPPSPTIKKKKIRKKNVNKFCIQSLPLMCVQRVCTHNIALLVLFLSNA
jgi:hypothetical protein